MDFDTRSTKEYKHRYKIVTQQLFRSNLLNLDEFCKLLSYWCLDMKLNLFDFLL